MRPVPKTLLTLAVVGALAALVVVTKPGPSPVGRPDRASAPRPAPTAANAADTLRVASVAPSAAASSGPAALPTNTAFVEHGRTAVLRADDADGARRAGLLPAAVAPDWSAPEPIKFFHLKQHYRAHRKRGAFDPALLAEWSGRAVSITGAFMPIDPIPDDGQVRRFWLANPLVVMAGCVFCSPPTLADLLYVTTGSEPLEVDREKLFRDVLMLELVGRLRFGPVISADGVSYLFALELHERLD